MPAITRRVLLHIGAPESGTSAAQSRLDHGGTASFDDRRTEPRDHDLHQWTAFDVRPSGDGWAA